jgi:two-component system nitrogen regulation sensor histidine kinase NtrY
MLLSLRLKGHVITIASIKNIQTVLENQEIESWQKLIRVLTHEIMNSITPISSLTSTVDGLLMSYIDEQNIEEEEAEDLIDIRSAIHTIRKRSDGLIHFVDTYRNLTKIPTPNFKQALVCSLLENVRLLFKEECKNKKIDFKIEVNPENIVINADVQLIEQVIINLVKNSIQALEGVKSPKISIKASYNQRSRPTIQVSDNGKGIIKEVLDKIFIPFFTTKTSGSGIGLSLSRQILRLHNGSISARSVPNKETTFTLTF